jgi:hypothetical protein
MQSKRELRWLIAAVTLWLGAIVSAMALLVSHSRVPGGAGAGLEYWPDDAEIPHSPGIASLVVFLHPECPCSQATIAELARVLSKSRRPIQVTACLASWKSELNESSLWQATQRIPGVTTVADEEGRIAKWFGASTSGTAMLFDERGKLLFLGGITGARGHEGDNAGKGALIQLLNGQSRGIERAHVYGCSIF